MINNNTVFTLGGWVRRDGYNYYPSRDPFADLEPDLQLQTIGQDRTLTNAGARADVAYVKGINNIKAGVVFEHTLLTEDDSFGARRSHRQRRLFECGRESRIQIRG